MGAQFSFDFNSYRKTVLYFHGTEENVSPFLSEAPNAPYVIYGLDITDQEHRARHGVITNIY